MDLFQLLGTITIKNSDANNALEETGRSAEKTKSKLSTAFSAVGKGALAVGKTIGTGLLAAGTAMGGLTIKAMNLAGELEQNMGGSEQVFKEYAGKMQETARSAFENMGLSTSDFLGTANKMGALFQGAGFSIEESSNLASDAMQRAADVASIMGIDTASAMEAIAGAAKGNFTMMDNLGVAMNDTNLEAYALSKGITKATKDMTQQEKIGLAMEMFMEKTAYAAGNYARENETLAGSLGTAKAALTNFLDGSGDVESLVTSFTNAAHVIIDNLKQIAPRLISGISDILNEVMPMLPPLLQEILPVIVEGAINLVNGLVTALPSIIDTLMSALPSLIEGVQQIFNALIQALPMIMQSLITALPTLIPMLISGLVSMIVMVCQMIPQIIQPLIDSLPTIIITIVNTLLQNIPTLIMGLIQLVAGLVMALPQILAGLWEALTTLVSNAVSGLFAKIKEWIMLLFPQSGETIIKILGTIKNAFVTWINNLKAVFSVVVSVISTPFKLAWNGIKTVWSVVVNYFKMIWNNIKAVFSAVDKVLSGDFKGAWESIKSIWGNVKQFFSSIISSVKQAFSNVGEILSAPFKKGKEAIGKIVDNIKGFFTGLKLDFPKIKLPHFSITPSGWGIGDLFEGVIPKLGIEWYAKGAIMKEPTLFGYNPATGSLRVGGEAGDEAIAPISTLQQYVSNAVASQNAGLIAILSKILDAILAMDENMGGNLREALEDMSFDVNGREFARLVRGTV